MPRKKQSGKHVSIANIVSCLYIAAWHGTCPSGFQTNSFALPLLMERTVKNERCADSRRIKDICGQFSLMYRTITCLTTSSVCQRVFFPTFQIITRQCTQPAPAQDIFASSFLRNRNILNVTLSLRRRHMKFVKATFVTATGRCSRSWPLLRLL
jgi:hypothetical protein